MIGILLQNATSGQDQYSFYFMIAGMLIIMYFFVLRPNSQKKKKQKKFNDSLTKGDSVVTIGGMHGKVYSIDGGIVILEVDKGVKLRFDKASLSYDQTESANNPLQKK